MKNSIYNTIINMDSELLNFLSVKTKNNFLDRVMPKITRSNDYGLVYLLFAIVILLWQENLYVFFNILTALSFGLIFGEWVVKYIVKRKRPSVLEGSFRFLIKLPSSFSFPSGHTTSSFAVLGVVWYMNLKYKYIILALALLISFSRVYLHVHYPMDVIAGMVLGLICSKMTILLTSHFDLVRFACTYGSLISHTISKFVNQYVFSRKL